MCYDSTIHGLANVSVHMYTVELPASDHSG